MQQARKRRIARICAVGGTQEKNKKLVKGVTSEMKICKSLKMSQLQNNGCRLVTFQTTLALSFYFILFFSVMKGLISV
jgi:hypothetical protein